jgi:hypothetical protein
LSDTTALPVGVVVENRVEDPAARVPVSKSGTAAAAVAPACASWSVCTCPCALVQIRVSRHVTLCESRCDTQHRDE